MDTWYKFVYLKRRGQKKKKLIESDITEEKKGPRM